MVIILLYSRRLCPHRELIWNKYRRTAIPEYLINFPSGKKKEELKDRPAISSSPFLFLYFWLFPQTQLSSSWSLQPVRWSPPKSVQLPSPQPLFGYPKADFYAFSAHCYQYTPITTHINPVSPACLLQQLLQHSISSFHVPLCLSSNSAKPRSKHSFKLLTLLERSLFLCRLPSVWESACMPLATKTLGQS